MLDTCFCLYCVPSPTKVLSTKVNIILETAIVINVSKTMRPILFFFQVSVASTEKLIYGESNQAFL